MPRNDKRLLSRFEAVFGLAVAAGVAIAFDREADANDSAASLAAGGIVLEATDHVAMISEDLRISADEVAVDYRFESVTGRAETLRVAFPLPQIDTELYAFESWPLVADTPINFVDFELAIDGAVLIPQVEQRALAPDGTDVTALVEAAGLPLSPFGTDLYRQVEALAGTPLLDKLVGAGIVRDWDDWPLPAWRVDTMYHWEMTVPAAGTINVMHRYMPAAGAFFHYPHSDWRQELSPWCVGDYEYSGIRRLAGTDVAIVRAVDYILMTANNWAGPIRNFRLTIDKGHPDAIVSLCFDGDLSKVDETRFVFEAENFRPTQDLSIAFFRPVGS